MLGSGYFKGFCTSHEGRLVTWLCLSILLSVCMY